jgi:hypothetical protein
MTTARVIIDRAFSKIGIRATETPLEASEIQDGLDVLNDMLAEWNANGTLKGADPVNAVGDQVQIPREAEGAVKANLAIRLAGEYERPVTQAMAFDATNSMNEFLSSSIDLDNIDYPSTLPIGSGNQRWYQDTFGEYFPESSKKNF